MEVEKKLKLEIWSIIGVVVVILVIIIFYYMVNRDENYDGKIYNFSDPNYEIKKFEINLVDMPQLYESDFEFNCTFIKNVNGEKVNRSDRYKLIKNKNTLDFMTVTLEVMSTYFISVDLNTPNEYYNWYIYPDGSIKPIMKFDEPFLPEDIKESNVTWLCQKTELNDDIFQPPEGIDFEEVSTSWKDLQEQLKDIRSKLEKEK